LVYQLINRFPIFEPQQLPLTALDRAIPFVPELLPLYISYIPFFWWTGARSEDDETATRFFYATHFQLLVCAAIWLIFPVTMPRELFYRPEAYNWADAFWRWFDAPNNCLPSLHAANGLLFVLFNKERPAAVLSTAFALAIVASTVLVKQHYVIDLLAGAIVFLITRHLLGRVTISN
jgi:membrane-associated phospholipid phosphatase